MFPEREHINKRTRRAFMKNYEYCIFISQFQPFHAGHEFVLREALDIADNVIVFIGSHKVARNIEVPFSTEERLKMVSSVFNEEELKRIKFIPLRDKLYNKALWVTEVQQRVAEITGESENITLIGRERDADYLKEFPQWNIVWVDKNKYPQHDAKDIKYRYFTYDTSYARYVPASVAQFMAEFQKTEAFKNLKEEFDFIKRYHNSWDGAPFKPTFVTVDAVVLKSGHVLCVRRRGNPGKGLIALPGGFLNQDELIEDASIRELKEETSIKLSKDELKKSIIGSKVFDYPYRSLRGRTITHAFMLDLGAGPLDKVKGSDDAAKSFWLPLNEISDREEEFFEDHYHMIQNMVFKY